MQYINYLSYALSIIFLLLAIKTIVKEYRYRQAMKPDKDYQKQTKKLKALGMKPFKFNKGKNEIWAHSLSDAQREFNASRSNRKTKSKPSKS